MAPSRPSRDGFYLSRKEGSWRHFWGSKYNRGLLANVSCAAGGVEFDLECPNVRSLLTAKRCAMMDADTYKMGLIDFVPSKMMGL